MIYNGHFIDNQNNDYRVEINTLSGTESQTIKLNVNPFIVEYNRDKDIFKPLKLSGATVRCWVDDYMFDIFSGKAKGTKCTLYKGDNIEWQGYVTPNVYNQDYLQYKFELDIECVDGLSILEYFNYQTDKKTVNSFMDVIKKAIANIDLNYNILYVHAFSDYRLENLYISEQNWYNEDDEALTYKEVLENILQYLNLTMFQYKGDIYIIDYNLIKTGNYQFHTYNLKTGIIGSTAFTIPILNIDESTIYQTPTISLTEVYNKININSSLYQSDIYIPDLCDLDNLEVVGDERTENDGINIYKIQLLNNSKFEFMAKNKAGIVQNIPYSVENNILNNYGCVLVRSLGYDINNSRPVKNEWTYHAVFRRYLNGSYMNSGTDQMLLKTKKNVAGIFPKGFFNLSMQVYYQFNEYYNPQPKTNKTKKSVVSEALVNIKLRVGDYYYIGLLNNGQWIHKDDITLIDYCTVYVGEIGDSIYFNWLNLTNTNKYINGVNEFTGRVIPTPPDFNLYGDIEFEIAAPNCNYHGGARWYSFVKDIKLEFLTEAYVENRITERRETDTLYSTDINSDNITEFNDIDLKVTSFTGKGFSYSAVAYKTEVGFDFVQDVLKRSNNESGLFEEHLLDSYYRQNSIPRKSIDLSLKGIVNPLNRVKDFNFPNDNFIINSVSFEYANNISILNLIEIFKL